MIIYVRWEVTGNGNVDNVFFDIVELDQGTDSESLCNALKNSVLAAGMDKEFLRKNLISIATDGAAVLTWRQTGLIGRLKQDFPRLQAVHCLTHHLELALKVVAGCNHLEFFLSKLCSLPPVLEKCKGVRGSGCRTEHADIKNRESVYNKMGIQQFQHREICAEGFSSVSTSLSIN